MGKLLPIAAAPAEFLAPQAGAQGMGGMDLAVAQKWAAAKVVRYRAEGVRNGRESDVFGDYEQFQSVSTDRKSFSMKAAERWGWTYTPTLVQ